MALSGPVSYSKEEVSKFATIFKMKNINEKKQAIASLPSEDKAKFFSWYDQVAAKIERARQLKIRQAALEEQRDVLFINHAPEVAQEISSIKSSPSNSSDSKNSRRF